MMGWSLFWMNRTPKGSLEGFQADWGFDSETLFLVIKIAAFLIVLGLIVNKFFGNRFHTRRKIQKEPLKYKKIVLDGANIRQGIRVSVDRDIVFESAHFPGKQKLLPESGRVIDLSLKGLAFVSTLEFPVGTDINFKILESTIAASPTLTGTVVATRPWHADQESVDASPLYFTSLNLRNVGEKARHILNQIVTEKEREMLAHQKDRLEETPIKPKKEDN